MWLRRDGSANSKVNMKHFRCALISTGTFPAFELFSFLVNGKVPLVF